MNGQLRAARAAGPSEGDSQRGAYERTAARASTAKGKTAARRRGMTARGEPGSHAPARCELGHQNAARRLSGDEPGFPRVVGVVPIGAALGFWGLAPQRFRAFTMARELVRVAIRG